jgi:CYTH domain-containing protein
MDGNVNLEIERKFIIEAPLEKELSRLPGHTESRIKQIYLDSNAGETRRIRRREYPDHTVYYETKKIRIDGMSATEIEREIGADEFAELENQIKSGTSPVNKIRHTFPYEGHTFEIDVYPEWRRSCIMEVELKSRAEDVKFPPFIKILREVTGDSAYSNAQMSKRFPGED